MKKRIIFLISMIVTLSLNAQNIEFTFDNAQLTNDGTFDYYEVDVLIATVDGQADFKLGKGQVYINYNTAAFGTFINGAGGIEITYPEVDGYILGLTSGFPYYSTTGTGIADNSDARFSFAYQQGISSGSMPSNNVTSTATKLFHIKMQFTDTGELPMVAFEDNETQPPGVAGCRDQFETACGPTTSGFPDCVSFPGTVFNDANFNSGGATLSTKGNELLNVLSVYPNPFNDFVNIKLPSSLVGTTIKIDILDSRGRLIKSLVKNNVNTNINIKEFSDFEDGSYFITVTSQSKGITFKQIIKKE